MKEYIPLEILAKIFLNFKDKKIAITMVSGLASFFPKVTDLRVSFGGVRNNITSFPYCHRTTGP